jgi:pimeloyl-ACP methyl ester carboxylesterase
MGGQEALLLLAEHPTLLSGVVAFDAPTDLALRYRAIARLWNGAFLQRLMRKEVGGTPTTVPVRYADRSPLHFAANIARASVPIELWWSRRDQVVVDQPTQSGRLFRRIRQLNPGGRFREVIGTWSHMAEMSWREHALRAALRWLGITRPSA